MIYTLVNDCMLLLSTIVNEHVVVWVMGRTKMSMKMKKWPILLVLVRTRVPFSHFHFC